jgi:hypothetical protein
MLERYTLGYEEEAKTEEDKASCLTCNYYDAGTCGLFAKMNQALPEDFELTESVSKDGWCRGFTPLEKSFKGMRKKADARRREIGKDKESKEKEEEEYDDAD